MAEMNSLLADSNFQNLLAWMLVCSPLVLIVPAILWARRRQNNLVREQLKRMEAKLDRLLDEAARNGQDD